MFSLVCEISRWKFFMWLARPSQDKRCVTNQCFYLSFSCDQMNCPSLTSLSDNKTWIKKLPDAAAKLSVRNI